MGGSGGVGGSGGCGATGGIRVKVAVTVFAASIDTVHGSAPEQPPPENPVNVDVAVSGCAVRVTAVPCAYAAVQSACPPVPQSMPAGALST